MDDFFAKLRDWVLDWFPGIFVVGVLLAILAWFILGIPQHLRERRRRIARAALADQMKHAVSAKIVESILPMERGAKYEMPLSEALEQAQLGVVTGGGTQMGKANTVEWVEIELALADLDGALAFARQKLRELGAPAGSVLEYNDGQREVSLPIIQV